MLDRRALLIGTGIGGALLIGWGLTPRRAALPLSAGEGEFAFDGWLKLGRDGLLSVAVPQLEMGQGVTTILCQIAATELGADWRQVVVEPAPADPLYANGVLAAKWASLWMPAFERMASGADSSLARSWAEHHSFTATADGTTLAAYEAPLRAAAASARAMLAMAAAARWSVDWRECEAQAGRISHGQNQLRFGDLVADAVRHSPPSTPPLRAKPAAELPAQFPPGMALAFPRLDLPSKADGSHVYAGDVRLSDLVYAAIRHAPHGDAKLTAFDRAKASQTPGFISLVESERWLASVAENSWAAEQALKAAMPKFKVIGAVNSDRINAAQISALHGGDATQIATQGDPDTWLSGNFSLAQQYQVAPALHASIETASVTARFSQGRLELWLASQAPESARRACAAAVGIAVNKVTVYPLPAGGSFDARFEYGHAVAAAQLARASKRPVQLIYSRWQEHVAALPRPAVTAVMAARTAATGELIALKTRIACAPAAREFGRRLFAGDSPSQAMASTDGKGDALAIEGANPPYAIEHLLIEHVSVACGLPVGRLRGNAHGYTAFFTECFIDELAAKAKHEPLSYRMAMLGGDPRLGQCLQRVSALAQWNGGADGSGQGIACHRIGLGPDGTGLGAGRIAAIATARRDAQGVRVDKIVAVADIGRIVNIDIARQQIEGGLVFGLGLALGSSTGYRHGLPLAEHIGALNLPHMATCPEIIVELIASSEEPCDPGELGAIIVAPAVANALFSATGLRFRKLPLLSEDA